jgi:hypothetical protein
MLSFSIAVPINALTTDAILTGSLNDSVLGHSAAVTGLRNPFSTTNKATRYTALSKGYHTFGLEIPAALNGDLQTPQGNGYGSLTVADLGTLTLAGRTADGIAYTIASITGYNGAVPSFVAFATTTPGSLLGTPSLAVASPSSGYTSLAGTLSWSRSPAPTTSKDQTYRAGFGPINLTLAGGNYIGPSIGPAIGGISVVMGLTNTDNKASLSFAAGGLPGGQAALSAFSIRNLKPVTSLVQTVTVPAYNATALPANPNPFKVTFKLDAKPAGQFSGSLTLPNATASLNRVAKYQGIIIHRGGSFEAIGYFLLTQLPQPGQTLLTSPVLSGQVILSPAL